MISDTDIKTIRDIILENFGLYYSEAQEKELLLKLRKASECYGSKDFNTFLQWITQNNFTDKDLQKLSTHLTIGETYFFREKKSLDYLEQVYLPGLIQKRKNNKSLKIWSAGCASGEEPYSIAILLSRLIKDIHNWKIEILATDINPDFLNKAKSGIYSKWSFRRTGKQFQTSYFHEVGNCRYQIKSAYRKMVKFTSFNLNKDSFPCPEKGYQGFDIIICRNVLIYFSKAGIEKVSRGFYHSLREEGLFLVSPVESAHFNQSAFSPVGQSGIPAFLKKDKQQLPGLRASSTLTNSYNLIVRKPEQNFPHTGTTTSTRNNPVAYSSIKSSGFGKTSTPEIQSNPKPFAHRPEKELYESDSSLLKKARELFQGGKLHESEQLIYNALKPDPRHKEKYLSLLASIMAGTGRYEEAIEICTNCLKKNKVNSEFYYLLAEIYFEQGDLQKAVKALQHTLFLDPEDARAHFILGNIYLQKGEKAKAKKSFENSLGILAAKKKEEVLNDTEGITAGNLAELIDAVILKAK